MTPNPGRGPVLVQHLGQLSAFFNQAAPFDGVFPQSVDTQECAFWRLRAGAMSGSMTISETVVGKTFTSPLSIPHGTTSNIQGVADNTYAAGDYLDCAKPSGAPGQDWLKAIWDHRFELTDDSDPFSPVTADLRFTMLQGLSWPGVGDWSMQWKISGVLSPVDNSFPFSTRPQDFNNPVQTEIVGKFSGADVVRGSNYNYENIAFYEEDGTDSGLSGTIELAVTTWFAWAGLYNTATGNYA